MQLIKMLETIMHKIIYSFVPLLFITHILYGAHKELILEQNLINDITYQNYVAILNQIVSHGYDICTPERTRTQITYQPDQFAIRHAYIVGNIFLHQHNKRKLLEFIYTGKDTTDSFIYDLETQKIYPYCNLPTDSGEVIGGKHIWDIHTNTLTNIITQASHVINLPLDNTTVTTAHIIKIIPNNACTHAAVIMQYKNDNNFNRYVIGWYDLISHTFAQGISLFYYPEYEHAESYQNITRFLQWSPDNTTLYVCLLKTHEYRKNYIVKALSVKDNRLITQTAFYLPDSNQEYIQVNHAGDLCCSYSTYSSPTDYISLHITKVNEHTSLYCGYKIECAAEDIVQEPIWIAPDQLFYAHRIKNNNSSTSDHIIIKKLKIHENSSVLEESFSSTIPVDSYARHILISFDTTTKYVVIRELFSLLSFDPTTTLYRWNGVSYQKIELVHYNKTPWVTIGPDGNSIDFFILDELNNQIIYDQVNISEFEHKINTLYKNTDIRQKLTSIINNSRYYLHSHTAAKCVHTLGFIPGTPAPYINARYAIEIVDDKNNRNVMDLKTSHLTTLYKKSDLFKTLCDGKMHIPSSIDGKMTIEKLEVTNEDITDFFTILRYLDLTDKPDCRIAWIEKANAQAEAMNHADIMIYVYNNISALSRLGNYFMISDPGYNAYLNAKIEWILEYIAEQCNPIDTTYLDNAQISLEQKVNIIATTFKNWYEWDLSYWNDLLCEEKFKPVVDRMIQNILSSTHMKDYRRVKSMVKDSSYESVFTNFYLSTEPYEELLKTKSFDKFVRSAIVYKRLNDVRIQSLSGMFKFLYSHAVDMIPLSNKTQLMLEEDINTWKDQFITANIFKNKSPLPKTGIARFMQYIYKNLTTKRVVYSTLITASIGASYYLYTKLTKQYSLHVLTQNLVIR